MKMFSIALMAALALASFGASAQTTPENASQPSAELTAQLAQMDDAKKAEVLNYIKSGKTSETARKAQEWVDVGTGVGEGLAAAAGRLGIEVNKFAQTPVGKLAMVLIVWHYMGEDISGWICGILFWGIFLPFWFYAARKSLGVYDEKGKFLRFDRELFNDKTTYGILPLVMLISLVLIVVIGIVFIA